MVVSIIFMNLAGTDPFKSKFEISVNIRSFGLSSAGLKNADLNI